MTEFDPLRCPLDSINLVEAGAGTGKTYSIQTLYLRILLQKKVPVQHILVVTFTEAATAELKERMRSVLNKMRLYLHGQLAAGDKETERLAAIAQSLESQPEAAQLAETALRDFDQAAISTIHGFCRRMLSENAFETSMRYGVELKKEVKKLYLELLNDFCRHHLYGAADSERELNYALELQAALLAGELRPAAGKSGVTIYWGETRGDLAAAAGDLHEQYQTLQTLDCGAVLAELLPLFTAAGQDRYRDVFAGLGAPSLAACKLKADKNFCFDRDFLRELVTKRPDRRGPFDALWERHQECFTVLEQFARDLRVYWRSMLKSAFEFAAQELEVCKQRNNFMTFDDLLLHLQRQLSGPGGAALAEVIRRRFPYALLDEFQDTDPVQFEVFSTIFHRDAPDSAFFMIGDPKQAIYNFRGGDIFAYLAARRSVRPERCYTLSVNYRSSRAFLTGVNAFYQRQKYPFAMADIEFHPIRIPDGAAVGSAVDGLHFTWSEDMVTATVNHVGALLRQKVKVEEIAVLVMNSSSGNKLEAALRERNLPVNWSGKANIFDTREAKELLLLLEAAADPGNGALAAELAAGAFLGKTALEIDQLKQSGEFLQLRSLILAANQLWSECSFMAMFHRFLSDSGAGQLLAQTADGERKLANLFQLAELLHRAALERRLGPAGLVAFLRDRIMEEDKEFTDDLELRTSSSRPSLTIMTVHKSKGLEFKHVILPDMQQRTAGSIDTFHDEAGRRLIQLADDDFGVARGRAEALQEFLRFLYVGITRAKHSCLAVLKPLKDAPAALSAIDYLARVNPFDGTLPASEELLSFLQHREANLSVFDPVVAVAADDFIYPSGPVEAGCLQTFDTMPERGWSTGSFTSMTAAGHAAAAAGDLAAADYDALTAEDLTGELIAPEPVLQLPAGVRFGICCHRMLEELEFDGDAAQMEECVRRNWQQYFAGDPAALPTIGRMIRDVLISPLDGSLHLADINRADRLSELKFTCQLKQPLDGGKLRRIAGETKLAGEGAFMLPAGTMLTGEIDLVFRHRGKYFLVDWKTNLAGGDLANFAPGRLLTEMHKNQYCFQYLLYLAGFFRFLSSRGVTVDRQFYEHNFGGVYYLFLRGISPSHPGRGIYFDKPDYGLLEALIHEIN